MQADGDAKEDMSDGQAKQVFLYPLSAKQVGIYTKVIHVPGTYIKKERIVE